MTTVLLVDDDHTHRLIHRTHLEQGGMTVTEAASTEAGFTRIVLDAPDCVVLDYLLPGEDGFQLLHRLSRDMPRHPPVVLLTCALSEELKRNALALGAAACLDKSTVTRDELVAAVRRVTR